MTDFLSQLTELIADRKAHPKPGSYTNELLADKLKAAQKVGEEATEVVVATLAQSDDRVIEEMADLVYHMLVLLETRNLKWVEVVAALEKRCR